MEAHQSAQGPQDPDDNAHHKSNWGMLRDVERFLVRELLAMFWQRTQKVEFRKH